MNEPDQPRRAGTPYRGPAPGAGLVPLDRGGGHGGRVVVPLARAVPLGLAGSTDRITAMNEPDRPRRAVPPSRAPGPGEDDPERSGRRTTRRSRMPLWLDTVVTKIGRAHV